jgi:hypothetical protein
MTDEDVLLWCLEHFYHIDKANACIHVTEVRYSPITFRLAEVLAEKGLQDQSFYVARVLADKGVYLEDAGR